MKRILPILIVCASCGTVDSKTESGPEPNVIDENIDPQHNDNVREIDDVDASNKRRLSPNASNAPR